MYLIVYRHPAASLVTLSLTITFATSCKNYNSSSRQGSCLKVYKHIVTVTVYGVYGKSGV